MTALSRLFARRRVGLALLLTLACVIVSGWGALRLFNYSLPMYTEDFPTAAESGRGDKAMALYNEGLLWYKQKNFKNAQEALGEAYSAMTEENTSPTGPDPVLAGKVQFLLGLSCEKDKQVQQAIDAYKQSLRHDPTNLEAKYNLERLLKGAEGKGQGGAGEGPGNKPGDKPGPGSSNQGKKGI